MNGWRNWLLSFMSGILVTLVGVYFTYPKDLVRTEDFKARMDQVEAHIAATDARVEQNRLKEEQDAYEMGRVQERLKMDKASE